MYLQSLELAGFKSFAKKSLLTFDSPISAIVGPNGSGKSNVAEAFRFVLGEQSIKSLRGKRGEDLIWNGSDGVPRANRAGVTLVFNNERRLLDIDFDEVEIGRVVHRDGSNTYSINGTEVRLRDVILLLAGANIGSSGYHIISQGEADRVLSAHPKERREMIEDALGLKVFQYKKHESEKRLAKCEENIAHVESLRKEIAPHLRFLSTQASKVEKSRALREKLRETYREYLICEAVYIEEETKRIAKEKAAPLHEIAALDAELKKAQKTLETSSTRDAKSEAIVRLENVLRDLRSKKESISREVGRVEGQIIFEEKRIEADTRRADMSGAVVSLRLVEELHTKILRHIDDADTIKDVTTLRATLRNIRAVFDHFLLSLREHKATEDGTSRTGVSDITSLKENRETLLSKAEGISKEEAAREKEYAILQKDIEMEKDEERSAERAIFAIRERQNAQRATLSAFIHAETSLTRAMDDRAREQTEAIALLGQEFEETAFRSVEDSFRASFIREPREKQNARRRELEKQKIRLEEFGGGSGEEIMKEYREIQERDAFLVREVADLEHSADTLRELIIDLDLKLTTKFKEGIVIINKKFQDFFSIMFGGGTAALSVSAPPVRKREPALSDALLEEDGMEMETGAEEEGVEVNVSLPRKRIKGLAMLSGGERALTSIALLFAMSSVNPPPFLVLDETDAALDEANSHRYGDMIETLSKHSQLILVTHNRETMSRAGILYGVTMGSSGVSTLLSVSFDEASAVAK